MPQHLDQPAAPAAEDEQVPAMRIALEGLLNQQRQPVEALAHVGVAGRKPHPRSARDRDHRRRLPAVSAPISADTVAGSAAPAIRNRVPLANSTSITPEATAANPACGANSGTIRTAAKSADDPRRAHNWRRHPYNWLG
jgi:hypothetical protein